MPSCGVSPRRPPVLPTALVGGLLLLGLLVTATADMPVDPALASYQRVDGGAVDVPRALSVLPRAP